MLRNMTYPFWFWHPRGCQNKLWHNKYVHSGTMILEQYSPLCINLAFSACCFLLFCLKIWGLHPLSLFTIFPYLFLFLSHILYQYFYLSSTFFHFFLFFHIPFHSPPKKKPFFSTPFSFFFFPYPFLSHEKNIDSWWGYEIVLYLILPTSHGNNFTLEIIVVVHPCTYTIHQPEILFKVFRLMASS